MIHACEKLFAECFDHRQLYRATGVVLSKLTDDVNAQLDLFGSHLEIEKLTRLYHGVDALSENSASTQSLRDRAFRTATGRARGGVETCHRDTELLPARMPGGDSASRSLAFGGRGVKCGIFPDSLIRQVRYGIGPLGQFER